MSLLETHGLTVRYGAVTAVDGLDLAVEPGRIVGLIGPNGAGKTTSIDALTGFAASEGRIVFDGRDIASWPAHRRARSGLGRTWQSLELFDDLSVLDNLSIAADHESVGRRLVRRRGERGRVVERAMDALGIAHLADRFPTELSQGQRKLVSSARALAGSPRILCMDEPAAGLDTVESRQLGRRIRDLADDGLGILLVDHDMGLVLEVCDHIVVIDFGATIAQGPPSVVRVDPAVLDAYLGGAHEIGGGR